MTGAGWAAAAALPAGAVAGWAIRRLLGRLRRGVLVPPGPLEATTAMVSGAGVVLAWGRAEIGMVVWAGLLAVALSAVDIQRHRLPDALTLPAIGVSVAVVTVTWWVQPDSGSPVRAVVAGAVTGAVFALLALAAPRAMGLGDVKLVVSLGVLLGYLSWAAVVVGIALAFVLGAVVALGGLALGRLGARSAIPFGPFLLAGGWLVLAVPRLLDAVLFGI